MGRPTKRIPKENRGLWNIDPRFVFDPMDDYSFEKACNDYKFTLEDYSYIKFEGEDYENNKKIHVWKRLFKRGSQGYADETIKPMNKRLMNVADTVDELLPDSFTIALFTFTCDTKKYGSPAGAWAELPYDVNRALCFLRNGAEGKRERIVRDNEGNVIARFNYKRPRMIGYILVYEDTELGYPAPHVIALFDTITFSDYAQKNPFVRKKVLRKVNDELTARYGQGFTKISEMKKGRIPKFNNIKQAVAYTTKYLSKGFDPEHVKYSQERSIQWIVRLKSQGKRVYSLSRIWGEWYNGIVTTNDIDLNIVIKDNSKVKWFNRGIEHGLIGGGDHCVVIEDYDFDKPPPDFGSEVIDNYNYIQLMLDYNRGLCNNGEVEI